MRWRFWRKPPPEPDVEPEPEPAAYIAPDEITLTPHRIVHFGRIHDLDKPEHELTPAELRDRKAIEALSTTPPAGWDRLYLSVTGLRWSCCGNEFGEGTEPRYVTHFATCPNADQHRRPR